MSTVSSVLSVLPMAARSVARWVAVRAAMLAAIGIGALALGVLPAQHARANEEIAVDRTARGTFALVDHTGRHVTDRDFRGRFMLVFFGYTSCPDVCPTDLQVIGAAVNALGEAGKRVQPIFVTLDPERDTADMLASYVSHFHPRFVGLTGAPEQVALAAQTYGAVYAKAMRAGGNSDSANIRYLIDHSAYIYLLGPDGRFLAAFPHGIDPKRLAAKISKHLKGHFQ